MTPELEAEQRPRVMTPELEEELRPLEMTPELEEELRPLEMRPELETEQRPLEMRPELEEELRPLEMRPELEEELRPLEMRPELEAELRPLEMKRGLEAERRTLGMTPGLETELIKREIISRTTSDGALRLNLKKLNWRRGCEISVHTLPQIRAFKMSGSTAQSVNGVFEFLLIHLNISLTATLTSFGIGSQEITYLVLFLINTRMFRSINIAENFN